MKISKTPDEFLRSSELGQILGPISERLKALIELKTAFENCVVLSVDTGKPAVDPFQLSGVLRDTRTEALSLLSSAEGIYDSLRQWSATESERLRAVFEPRLRTLCEKQSYRLDGRYPSYVVEGFLLVRVKDGDRKTEVGNRSVPSLLVDAIAPAIREQVTEERSRKFDRTQFIELLFQAYDRCALLQKASLGEPMPVRKVYQELVLLQQPVGFLKSAKKALFKEYTVEHFARDLGRLLETSPCRTSGGKLLSDRPTSFSQDGIPISQNGQARIVGKIVFSNEQP